jgi:ketosteroid isomerase-like protein
LDVKARFAVVASDDNPDMSADKLRLAFEAFARGDIQGTQQFFHPEAELRTTTGGLEGETYRGPNLVEDWVAGFRDVWTDYRVELDGIAGKGNELIAHVRNVARALGSGIPINDRRYVAFKFKDGLIWRGRTCPTIEEAQAALDAWP